LTFDSKDFWKISHKIFLYETLRVTAPTKLHSLYIEQIEA